MLILSRVCAEFHNPAGEVVFAVTPATRLTLQEAPDEIRHDPLFRMLVNDGSMEASVTEAQKRKLENDPAAGHDAAGKAEKPEAGSAPEPAPAADAAPAEAESARRPRAKAADRQ